MQQPEDPAATDAASPRSNASVIVATGEHEADALGHALNQARSALFGRAAGVGTGQAVVFRAEGPDLASLLPALAREIADQIEIYGRSVRPIDIHGVVRSDTGMVAWGTAELTDSRPPETPAWSFTELVVTQSPDGVTIRARLITG